MQQKIRRDDRSADLAARTEEPAPQPVLRHTSQIFADEPSASAISPASPMGEISLNYEQFRRSRIPLPGEKNSVTFNEFRSVKRKLLPLATRMGERRPQNLVMVSSALPSEGKTFTSVNLAVALAAEKISASYWWMAT